MKPGYRTTEFWITLATQVLTLLAVTGWISGADRDNLTSAVTQAITAVFSLLTSAGVVKQYIQSRAHVKTAMKLVLVLALSAGASVAHAQTYCPT